MAKILNKDSTPVPFEDALLEEVDCVSVSVDRFEHLIRSETELSIMEAAIDEMPPYDIASVLKALRIARAKHARVLVVDKPEKPGETSDA